jgi:hypothetical protein
MYICKSKCKGKVHPITCHEDMEGEYSFFSVSAKWEWVVNAMPWPLYCRERPGIHCTEGWVGLRAVLDGVENLAPHRGSNPKLNIP